MIYLDNSASTYVKPKEVIKAVNDALLNFTANPGRSGHAASIHTAMEIERVRARLTDMFGCQGHAIFTHNCTSALNLALLGSLKPGGHIVCTENEHNSVLRPLEHLKNKSLIDYTIAFQHDDKGIKKEDIIPLLRDNTYLVVCNHISNVNGDKADIAEIGKECKKRGILFLVDGAQSLGHTRVNMCEDNIDMLAFAGHKGLYAPQSIGGLLINGDVHLEPIVFGGTGTNSLELIQPQEPPERYESGTISTPLILGLGAGVEFVQTHFDEIKNRLDDLTTYLNYELSKLPVECYTHPENANGVLAFNIKDVPSNEFATYLDEKWGICVRGGYQCAPIKHQALGTLEQGVVRVSLSYFNNFSQVQRLLFAIKTYLRKNSI